MSVVLAIIGGFVDAAGYLALFHLFTSHMSGNSAASGAFAGVGQWREALHRAFPIPCFVVGVILGAAITEVAMRRKFRSPFALALLVEALLLLLCMLMGNALFVNGAIVRSARWQFYSLVALPAVAMGVQNATLRRVGRLHVRTTYISELLTHFGEAFVVSCFRAHQRRAMYLRMAVYGGLWAAFTVGAICGGFAEVRWGLNAFVIPLCGLALVIVQDLIAPLAVRSNGSKKSV